MAAVMRSFGAENGGVSAAEEAAWRAPHAELDAPSGVGHRHSLLVVLVGAAKPGLGGVAALGLVVVWIAREIRDRRRAPRSIAAIAPAPPTHCAACGARLDVGASFCGECGAAARAR
jgi:hypothetical protein